MFTQIKMSVCRLVLIDIECLHHFLFNQGTRIPIDFYWYERIPMIFSIYAFVVRLVLIDKGHVHYVFKNKNVRSSIGLYRYRL